MLTLQLTNPPLKVSVLQKICFLVTRAIVVNGEAVCERVRGLFGRENLEYVLKFSIKRPICGG